MRAASTAGLPSQRYRAVDQPIGGSLVLALLLKVANQLVHCECHGMSSDRNADLSLSNDGSSGARSAPALNVQQGDAGEDRLSSAATAPGPTRSQRTVSSLERRIIRRTTCRNIR